MLCLKKRRTYSFTQGVCTELPRRSKKDNDRYEESLNMAITTLPRKNRTREERPSRMVLTVTEDTPADMLVGSMELLVQLPRDNHVQTQRVTVQRSTPMMDLLVQIATTHKLSASSYTLQAIGERGMILPHQPNTPIGALDALQVKLLPKQGTFVLRKTKQANQPFETTFRLQVHLPRNQLYVSRVSPKMILGDILDEVCREKGLDKNKYELRHPANLEEVLDLSLSLQDYHLQEVTLYAKQGRTLGSALSTQDIMALQRQEERRRQQAKQGVFGFVFKKSKEGSLSTDSLGGRSTSPARSDETGRSTSPLQPPARPQRKRRPAPKPPTQAQPEVSNGSMESTGESNKDKDKVVISHSRNSSDSSGYHEASVLSDNPDSSGRLPDTLPRRSKIPETPRKLAQTSQSSKSLSNLATVPGTLTRGISSTSLSSTGLRKKRTAPPPPVTRPLSSAISTQALERIVDSEESLTSDMDPSKPPSDIGAPYKASSDIEDRPKASSDIGVTTVITKSSSIIDFTKPAPLNTDIGYKASKADIEPRIRSGSINVKLPKAESGTSSHVEDIPVDARASRKRVGEPVPLPKPRKNSSSVVQPQVPKRKLAAPSPLSRTPSSDSNKVDRLSNDPASLSTGNTIDDASSNVDFGRSISAKSCESNAARSNEGIEGDEKLEDRSSSSISEDEVFLTPGMDEKFFEYSPDTVENVEKSGESKRKLHTGEDKENKECLIYGNDSLLKSEQSSQRFRKQERNICAVISTMPKCERLDILTENNSLANVEKAKIRDKKIESNSAEEDNADLKADAEDVMGQRKARESMKEPKRARISRTASKTNDFETNSLEKQKRHLTSDAEDITFALNLNVASNVALLSNESEEIDASVTQWQKDKDSSSQGEGGGGGSHESDVSGIDTNLSETDVLLQKVSDTLSNSLPIEGKPEVIKTSKEQDSISIKKTTDDQDVKPPNTDFPDGSIATSSPNLTVNSQQDTSDYVSAADEDLLVVDWEYQLPAPPSAFRDTASPILSDFKDPQFKNEIELSDNTEQLILEKPTKKYEPEIETKEFLDKEIKKEVAQEKPLRQQRLDTNLKKEVIFELENKIGSLPQTTKDIDSRKISDSSSTPQVAPVDNTLSNFKITTYTRQKSLNIFEEVDGQSREKNSDDRFIKSFATLSRNRNNLNETTDGKGWREFNVGTLQNKKKLSESEEEPSDKKMEPKIKTESLQRWQNDNEKDNIQRSKNHVSLYDKDKDSNTYEDENMKNGKSSAEVDDIEIKKSTNVMNLSTTASKSNEKFSQWRDNILKRQEEPTKEKQLQSLQVLKSILPQLKNAQQAEENVPKESNNTVLTEKTRSETVSNEHSIETNVVSARDSQAASNIKKADLGFKKTAPETNAKRYTYSGPPAISLGSWSERPSVNVQIKKDTDYKFGANKVNGKTIVNINGAKDSSGSVDNSIKSQNTKIEAVNSERREPDELAKKLITHTTASGFKKPVLNRVSTELRVNSDKPVVTAVELKKSFLENKQDNKQDDSVIDTSPVNFKELAKAFGEDVCLRSKPKRSTLNRRSELSNIQMETDSSKQNGHNASEKFCEPLTNGNQDSLKPKRFTSIVGIQSQNQSNLAFRNGVHVRTSQPLPVVKGFKLPNTKSDGEQNGLTKEIQKESIKKRVKESSESIVRGPQPPKPPTMPVITGVTLKSARPKSMPVQSDPRDILLESIRSFGGRGNLKSAAEKC